MPADQMIGASSTDKRERADSFDEVLASKLARTLQKQAMVASIQQEIAMTAPVNKPVTYVSGSGAVFRSAGKEDASQTKSCGNKAPKQLPDLVKVFAVSPATCPSWHRFKVVHSLKECHVVLMTSLQQQLYSPAALAARLFGKRIVDQSWADSRMKAGATVAYQPAIRSHLYIWVSDAWVAEFPDYAKVLQEAHDQVREWLVSGSSLPSLKFMRLTFGSFPPKVKHPRLSFAAVIEREFASMPDKQASRLTLMTLLDRLSCSRD